MAMAYGDVYVAQVALGANDDQTVKAFLEAEAWPGPSLDHRLRHVHRPRHRHVEVDDPPEATPCGPGTGRCTATTPARRARAPVPARRHGPSIPSSTSPAPRAASRCSSGATPSAPPPLFAQAQADVDERWRLLRAARRWIDAPSGGTTRRAAPTRRRARDVDADHPTTWARAGSPIVASAGPLTDHLDSLHGLDAAGVGAVVLPSLFEEQLEREELGVDSLLGTGADAFAEATRPARGGR